MNFDISHLLNQWEYEPGQVLARRFKGKDGKEKLQLRVDIGLLQMNAEGRPDGKRPFGHDSLLEHYEAELEKHIARKGDDDGFVLKVEDCARLQQEAIQYHHRYICLFQLEDYEAVLRDTERNLTVFDFVEQYAENSDAAWSLQQFRPQLLMMQVRARGAIALLDSNFSEALEVIEEGLQELREFFQEQSRPELADQSSEIQSLELWRDEIRGQRPLSEREKLELALDEAVAREDYEKAAEVRDALRKIKS